MKMSRCEPGDMDRIIELSLRAWTPFFSAVSAMMDPEVYAHLHPDWRETQRQAVVAAVTSPANEAWVARSEGTLLGFVVLTPHNPSLLGEIAMLAVDPSHQRRGIGTALVELAVSRLKRAGMRVAMVETGGDPSHLPARATYERLSFRPLAIQRYFLKLGSSG